jgi:hypothetical protein
MFPHSTSVGSSIFFEYTANPLPFNQVLSIGINTFFWISFS